jgi:hypothetical protein
MSIQESNSYMGGKAWDYPTLAAARLTKLAEVASMASTVDANAEGTTEFERYIDLTRYVLQALQNR